MRPSSRDLYRDSYTGRPASRGPYGSLLQLALVLGVVLAIFVAGDYFQRLSNYRTARAVGRTYYPSLEEVSYLDPLRSMALNYLSFLPRPWADQALVETGLPVYDLRIKTKDLAELQEIAERVTAQQVSTGIERPYFPAEFRMDGRWEPIDVKLRGLYAAHYIKTRPSLRLKFPRRKLLHGAKQVNLLDPYDKGLTVDVTTGWDLAQQGLMAWDSRFVLLRLNGDVIGVFQEIEQFGRSMSDRNARPEGPIFSGYGQVFGKAEGGIYEKAIAPLKRIQACLDDEDLRFQEGVAASAQDAPCDWRFFSEYFDTGKWAWAAAASQLLHSSHAWHPDNVRMFWDPARGSFEPIPWDYGYARIDPGQSADGEAHQSGYANLLLAAPEFRRMRDERTWTLLQERVEPMIEYSEALFASLAPALRQDLRHPDFAVDEARQADYVDSLRSNREVLTRLYAARDLRARVYPERDATVVVGLRNHAKSFVRVEAARVAGAAGERVVSLDEAVVVDGLWQGEPGSAWVAIPVAPGERVVALEARNAVTGSSFRVEQDHLAADSGPAPSLPAQSRPEFRLELEGVEVEGHVVRFGPGPVSISERIDVPRGFDVVIEAGSELHFAAGAALLIEGDLSALGTAERPIRISGARSAEGPEGNWGGVFVQGTRLDKSRVTLHHTTLVGGAGGENRRTFFTSSFAVHDGVVELRDCRFEDSRADDGMNLKYASVDLRDNRLARTRDDSLDCDFCTGELSRNEIFDSGGDGFDFSGSDVRIANNRVEGCVDKGMSIGERTMARLVENEIVGCYTGVAVKDLSEVEIRGLTLVDLQVGVAAYIKKPTFGPSRVKMADVAMSNVATQVLQDTTCSVEEVSPAILGAVR